MISAPTVALLLAGLAAPAAPAASDAATGSGLLVATAGVEQLPLPKGPPPAVEVDAMGGAVILRTRDPDALARFLGPRLGSLCGALEPVTGGVRLRCRTRRLAAGIVTGRTGAFLEIRELRGVPWRDGADGPPTIAWDTERLGGGRCPGVTDVAIGECALAAGKTEAAARRFRAAFDGPDRPWAAVRLGDLALAADRLEDAIVWWRLAGFTGPFARLAAARICELTGSCLGTSEAAVRFDGSGLKGAMRHELALRAIRLESFLGRPTVAARRLLAMPRPERAAACGLSPVLCRRIALEALRVAEGPDREEALAFYLSLAGHDRGPLSVELARAGAEAAAALGAQVFAGNLLAAVAGNVASIELPDHLLRAAELFVAGDDPVRAAVILDYARTRLPAKRLAEPRWAAVVSVLTAAAAPPAAAAEPPPDPDVARALEAIRRADEAAGTDS